MALMEKHSNNLKFILPEEAIFASIENVAIPLSNHKKELTYQFINFIYQPKILAKQVELGLTFPALHEALQYTEGLTGNYYQLFTESLKYQQYQLFHYIIPEAELQYVLD